MIFNDRNESPSFFRSYVDENEMKTDLCSQRQKDSLRAVDFSNDCQTAHKVAGRLTPNIDFEVTIFYNSKYLEMIQVWRLEILGVGVFLRELLPVPYRVRQF